MCIQTFHSLKSRLARRRARGIWSCSNNMVSFSIHSKPKDHWSSTKFEPKKNTSKWSVLLHLRQRAMPDLVSRAIICAISDYRHWPHLPGVEQDAELGLKVLCDDLGATAVTTTLAGHVTHDDLKRGFSEVIQDLKYSEEAFPVFVSSFVPCSADWGRDLSLIPSDSPTGEEEASRAAFDMEEHVLKPPQDLKFHSRYSSKVKKLRAILIFDCCRKKISQETTRGLRNLLPCLKHDFYMIFSCDQGRPSIDGASGGPLMSVLLPSLTYAKPIYEIFANASCQVSSQRPNDYNRMGLPWSTNSHSRFSPRRSTWLGLG